MTSRSGGSMRVVAALLLPLVLVACGGDEPTQSGPVFVHGTVSGLDDATVLVSLWPAKAGVIEEGESFQPYELAAVGIDGAGSYVVRVSPDDIPAEYVENAGHQNFDVSVVRGASVRTVPFSTTVDRVEIDGDVQWRSAGQASGKPLRIDFDFDAKTITSTASDGTTQEYGLLTMRG